MSILKASQLYHILYIHNYRNCMPGTYRELAISVYLRTSPSCLLNFLKQFQDNVEDELPFPSLTV